MQKNAESNYSFEHMLKVHRYGFNPHWPLSSQPCLSMLGKHFFSGEATFAPLPFTFLFALKMKNQGFLRTKRCLDPKMVISGVPCHKTLIAPINGLLLHYLIRRY